MPTASVVYLDAIVTAAADAGVDRCALLTELGVAEVALHDPDARIPFDVVARAWRLAADKTGDEVFGLHFGERAPFGAFDVIDWAVWSSSTASDAAARLAKFHRWINDAAHVTLTHDETDARIAYRIDLPWSPELRHVTEAALATYLARLRALARVRIVPRAVRFTHGSPMSAAEHHRFFGVRVEFGAATNELVFSRAAGDLPIAGGGEPSLQRIVDRQARAMLAKLPREGIAQVVSRCLVEMMREREPTLAGVASRLGLTPRSLQRRLDRERTSFLAVLEHVRREAALGYLAESRFEIAEIAARLGFSEPAAFHRAFRRWTGTTPRAYRAAR